MSREPATKHIDEKDMEIISLLRDNARMKYVDIAGEVDLSEAAVRFRVKRLIESDIITRFTVETSLEEPQAIVLIKIEPSEATRAINSLKKITGIVYELSGGWDAAVMLEADSTIHLNELVDQVRRVPGVNGTQSMLKLVTHSE